MIELGGNIKLVGFRELEPAKLIVVKKLVGNYARKINDQVSPFQELSLTLKEVRPANDSGKPKFELSAKVLIEGKNPVNASVTDYNLFFAIDKTLNKLHSGATN